MRFEDLKGFIFSDIRNQDNELIFSTYEGKKYIQYHESECCEDVYIEDICGDLKDLIDSPILFVSEESNSFDTDNGSCTWTFYNIATIKGSVTIRWFGESNGYYSEAVNFRVE